MIGDCQCPVSLDTGRVGKAPGCPLHGEPRVHWCRSCDWPASPECVEELGHNTFEGAVVPLLAPTAHSDGNVCGDPVASDES